MAGLRISGVRDWRLHLLALCSFPFISSLVMGQPDGFFVLGSARGRLDGDRVPRPTRLSETLLSADAHAFETRSNSLVAIAMRLGASQSLGDMIAIVGSLAVAFATLKYARRSDLGWFVAALALGLLISPILWLHYLSLLFVPLAISRRRLDWVWLVAATVFWISPVEPAHNWQIIVVILTASTIAIVSGRSPR